MGAIAASELEMLRKNPERIAAAVEGLAENVLRYRPAANKWCILEILAHLADVEIVYGQRLRQVLAEAEPTFAPMNQDDWAKNLGYLETRPEESLAVFRAVRTANLRLLQRVAAADLERGGFHPELGRKHTLAEILERMLKHDPNHLEQIERLKRQAGEAAARAAS